MAGTAVSVDALAEIWVLRLGVEGAIEWQKRNGGGLYDGVDSIQQTRDGGYIMGGVTHSFGVDAPGQTDDTHPSQTNAIPYVSLLR